MQLRDDTFFLSWPFCERHFANQSKELKILHSLVSQTLFRHQAFQHRRVETEPSGTRPSMYRSTRSVPFHFNLSPRPGALFQYDTSHNTLTTSRFASYACVRLLDERKTREWEHRISMCTLYQKNAKKVDPRMGKRKPVPSFVPAFR